VRNGIFVFVAFVACLACVAGVAATAARADGESAAPDKKDVLQVGWAQAPDNLNPFVGYQSTSYAIFHLNYDMLVRYDPDTLEPIPGLAESWEHSADGKTWTFHIRKDAKWQDGEPLTAHDVAFTFNYIIDNQMSAYTGYTKAIKKVTATDDYTAVFECSRPSGTMLYMWVSILPEHIWSKIDPDDAQGSYKNDPPIVGSGPFQVVEWKRNGYVRMVANKKYWGGAPHIDEILFRLYTNKDTLAADLRSGVLDMSTALDMAQYKAFEDRAGFTTNASVEDSIRNLGINVYAGTSMGHPALLDPEFRKALSVAIDRETIAKVAYSGAATPATSLLPSDFWGEPLDYHWNPPNNELTTYDPEKAKQMLDDAGYKDTDGDGIREYEGKPITLRLWSLQEEPSYASAGKLITGWLEDIGLQIEFETHDDAYVSDHIYNTKNGKLCPDYDLFVWGWEADFDPQFLLSVFLTEQINAWSDSGWSNPEYDRLYEEQQACLDPQKRKELIYQMQEIFYDQMPNVILVYPRGREVYNSAEWTGWVKQPGKTGSIGSTWTYLSVRPKQAVVAAGTNVGLIVGVIVAAVVVVGVVVLVIVRRRGRKGRLLEADEIE